ncbi:uncharacterized protein LOC130253446 [Oenanthe melanoleuca]|uniref:uncharacterized protein LOC130253446 n=1 Tax=Oenanthe melanoleuca TaxID=2939378 RepID=UPI0024C19FC2|nr:uncharacterized protein LOC130253446 [Oenanthe melanoleuca]
MGDKEAGFRRATIFDRSSGPSRTAGEGGNVGSGGRWGGKRRRNEGGLRSRVELRNGGSGLEEWTPLRKAPCPTGGEQQARSHPPPPPPPHSALSRAWCSWHKRNIKASHTRDGAQRAAKEMLGPRVTLARKGGGGPLRWFRPRFPPGARDRWSGPCRRARAPAAVTCGGPPRAPRARRTQVSRCREGVRAGSARPGPAGAVGKARRMEMATPGNSGFWARLASLCRLFLCLHTVLGLLHPSRLNKESKGPGFSL